MKARCSPDVAAANNGIDTKGGLRLRFKVVGVGEGGCVGEIRQKPKGQPLIGGGG